MTHGKLLALLCDAGRLCRLQTRYKTNVGHFIFRMYTKRVFSSTFQRGRALKPTETDPDEFIITSAELLKIKIVSPKQIDVSNSVVDEKKPSETKNRRRKRKSTTIQETPEVGNISVLSTLETLDGIDPVTQKEELRDRGSITEENSFTDFYQNIVDTYKTYCDRSDGEYIVLIHVGSFYELYFEQADKYSSILGLTLTKKTLKCGQISFSGFPDRMLDKYMNIIYNAGYKAVICNQVLDPVTNTLSRPVDRIMTPGIIVDETCRDFHRNNYLMALSFPEDLKNDVEQKRIGVAWCDVNLGQFYVLETEFSHLLATVTRINPSEILISDKVDKEKLLTGAVLPEMVDLKSYYITTFHAGSKRKSLDDFIWRFSDNKRLVSTTLDALSRKEKTATSLLLHYLDTCLPNFRTSFQLPARSLPKTLMQIDSRAAQDLELLETMQSRKRVGALSHLIDKTLTSPGARLLNTWLLAPSTDLSEIHKRHNLLALFMKDEYYLDKLGQLLKKTADVNRIIRRIDNNKADRFEYLELASTIRILVGIYELTVQTHPKQYPKFVKPIFDDFMESKKIHSLAKQIVKTIDLKVSYLKPNTTKIDGDIIREFWEIKDTASPHLCKLRKQYDELVSKSIALKDEIKSQYGVHGYSGSLRLIKDMKSYDYVIELKSTSKTIPQLINSLGLTPKERSKSVTKLLDSRWSEIGDSMVKLEYDITLEENQIMIELNSKISKLYKELRKLSPIIELLDVIQSFTRLALQYNLVKPNMDNSTTFDIKHGRHLVVEEGLKNRFDMINFTANDCFLDSSKGWVITGPNMGGKSTFLRQNALIAILAQIGSYVPASEAHIGVIDKIFTRVGSSDNIFKHQSTFMVEMNETAVILREATERSLVIVDELGRGTSTSEGVSIAYASLFRLLTVNKAKVLFATHFGPELMHLIESERSVSDLISFYKTTMQENEHNTNDDPLKPVDQRIIFDHKLTQGVCSHSHALKIAELAGFPKDVLEIATKKLEKLHQKLV